MKEAELRDQLALERTHLANERTLLAYIRTALALLAGGAVLLQFFPGYLALVWCAYFLVVAGAVMLVVGLCRFFIVRAQLNTGGRI